jgi:hypothetical protein
LKSENFIAFFTISGFFIGIIFSALKTLDIIDFFIYTLFITLFFYLFIHIVLVVFFNLMDISSGSFQKEEYEDMINYQISEMKVRENEINDLVSGINKLKI